MSDLIIGMGLQRVYFHPQGVLYLGEKARILQVRIEKYLESAGNHAIIYFTREIHQVNDTFFQTIKSHSTVGSPDVEIMETLKRFPKLIINTNRHSAFYKTPLDSELSKIHTKKVTIVGVETHTLVLFTAEEFRNRDYEVVVPEPLVMAHDDYLHSAAINIMSQSLSVNVE